MVKVIDLLGQKFEKLLVIRRDKNTANGRAAWLCKCGCGNEVVVRGKCLISGHTKSCGCLRAINSGMKGKRHTEKTKRRISKANKGRPSKLKGTKLSEERIRKMSEFMKGRYVGVNNHFYGKKHSIETKKKISESHKGENNPNYGRKFSEDHKRRISESNKGKKFSKETRERMSKSKKGKYVGENNPNWNPDRGYIFVMSKLKLFMYESIKRVLYNKNSERTEQLLGYSSIDLRKHLESSWKPGMSWGNYGQGKGKWCIDHIIPVSYFLDNGIKDPKIINALDNLQPLWWEENASKNNKILVGGIE